MSTDIGKITLKKGKRMVFILAFVVPVVIMLIVKIMTGDLPGSVATLATLLGLSLVAIFYLYKLKTSALEDRECYRMLYNCVDFSSMKKNENLIQSYRIEYEELKKEGRKISPEKRTRANLLYEVLMELGEDVRYFDMAVFVDAVRCPHKLTRHLGKGNGACH